MAQLQSPAGRREGRWEGGRQADGKKSFLQAGSQPKPPLYDLNKPFLGGAVENNTIWFPREELSEPTQVFSMVGYPG